MASLSIGEATLAALGGLRLRRKPARSGAPHPTGAHVLADSMEAGTFEHIFFVPPAKGETDGLLRAARKTLDAGKRLRRDARVEGRPLTSTEWLITKITAATVRVYEEILTLARLNNGRVFPTFDYLADATGVGRATVARAISALEAVGFLVRQRRFKRISGAGPGPRYEQTSNAYRALLPKRVIPFLPRWMRPAPLPADVEQREADRIEDTDAMLASLSCHDFAQVTVGGQLGKLLAKLGAALDGRERESQKDTQPLIESYNTRFNGVGLDGQHAPA